MALRVYNTLTRRKEEFKTIEPGRVRMYVCGVTVYGPAHIGHGFMVLSFDIIRRYLTWLGYDVLHAQNFTDVDDKIIARAAEVGIEPIALANGYVDEWRRDITGLGVLPPTIEPRATEEIAGMLEMIAGLIARGLAYEAGGDVYFRVRAFEGYGKLSRRSLDDLLSGRGWRSANRKRIRSTSPSGKRPSRAKSPGRARGVPVAPAGTSNAPRCR
jgi:cysteinyl-tRNA synthetase